MEFNFVISTTWEVKNNDIHYDLNDIEEYINERLINKSFGDSVHKFHFGYEIADSKGELPHRTETADLRRYGRKYLLIVKQFDFRLLKDKSSTEQFSILKEKILESIIDIDKLKKQPKDFERQEFYKTINRILTDYGQKRLR